MKSSAFLSHLVVLGSSNFAQYKNVYIFGILLVRMQTMMVSMLTLKAFIDVLEVTEPVRKHGNAPLRTEVCIRLECKE